LPGWRQLLGDEAGYFGANFTVADAVDDGAAAIRGGNVLWLNNLLQLRRVASCFQAQTPTSLGG